MGCAASKAPPKADASPATAEAGPVELPEGSTWYELGGAELEPCLASAFVVDVRWLLKFALGEVMPECEGVLPAWQQLPAAAEVKLEDLRRSKMKYNLPVGVTSYGWDSKARVKALSPSPRWAYTTCSRFSRGRMGRGVRPDAFACSPFVPSPVGPDCEALCFWAQGHPDRKGKTLQRLVPVLKAIVAACDGGDDGFPPTWGIVWDFMALPQRGYTTGYDPAQDDRTPEQLALFKAGLANINVRAHASRLITAHDAAPARHAPRTPHAPYLRGYVVRRAASQLQLPPPPKFQVARYRVTSYELRVTQRLQVWYGHPHVTTFALNLPMHEEAENQTPYDRRGWYRPSPACPPPFAPPKPMSTATPPTGASSSAA